MCEKDSITLLINGVLIDVDIIILPDKQRIHRSRYGPYPIAPNDVKIEPPTASLLESISANTRHLISGPFWLPMFDNIANKAWNSLTSDEHQRICYRIEFFGKGCGSVTIAGFSDKDNAENFCKRLRLKDQSLRVADVSKWARIVDVDRDGSPIDYYTIQGQFFVIPTNVSPK